MEERIKPAGFGKRLGAYLIDAAIVLITTGILWATWCSQGLAKQMGYNDTLQAEWKYLDESGLVNFTYNEDGSIKQGDGTYQSYYSAVPTDTQAKPGYEGYYDRLYNYYVTYLPNDSRTDSVTVNDKLVAPKDYYTHSYFNTVVMSLPDPTTITDYTNESSITSTNGVFKYALNDAGTAIDIDKKPVLTKDFQTHIDAGSSDNDYKAYCTNAQNFFISYSNSSYSGCYYKVGLMNLFSQSFYTNYSNSLTNLTWALILVAYLPIHLIVFMVIPMCTRNGQTIGKLLMRLAVVSKDGYTLPWWSRFVRPLIMGVIGSLIIVFPTLIYGFLIYAGVVLIDYISMAASKDGTSRTFHDKIAGTMVVDAKESVWFSSPEAEEDYLSKNPVTDLDDGGSIISPDEAARIERENSVLDLSTLNKHKDEAHAMTSFDEFEKTSYQTKEAKIAKEKAVALDSLASSIKNEDSEKLIKDKKKAAKPKKALPPDESGFTDDSDDSKK